MRCLIPAVLWIGNAHDAADVESVLDRGIAAVTHLAIEESAIQFPRDVIYCRFPLLDGAGNRPAVIQAAIEATAIFVHDKLPTLVTCSNGVSRSLVIVAAAVSQVSEIPLDDALRQVTNGVPHDISPALWEEVKRLVSRLR